MPPRSASAMQQPCNSHARVNSYDSLLAVPTGAASRLQDLHQPYTSHAPATSSDAQPCSSHALAMNPLCTHHAPVMPQPCNSHAPVLKQSCNDHARDNSVDSPAPAPTGAASLLQDLHQPYTSHTPAMHQSCTNHATVMQQSCTSHAPVMKQPCVTIRHPISL